MMQPHPPSSESRRGGRATTTAGSADDLATMFGSLTADLALVVPLPSARSTPTAVVFWEPGIELAEGSVVLGVNLTESNERQQALRVIGQARCAALILRAPDDRDEVARLKRRARSAGTGLLLLRGTASWMALGQEIHEALRATAGTNDTDSQVPLGDLFALSDALADMLGGPVILEDAAFRVLAYSRFTGHMDRGRTAAILGRRMPDEWAEHLRRIGALDKLRHSTDVVDMHTGPWRAHRRLITAIREGARTVGIIWLAEGDTALPEDSHPAMRRAAEIALPHLQRHLEVLTAHRQHRQRLVRAILDGQGPVQRYAEELDFPRTGRLAVMAFSFVSTGEPPDGAIDRVLDHIALSCEAFRWRAALTQVGRRVLVILHVPARTEPGAAVRLGNEIVKHAPVAAGEILCGAVSSPCPGAHSLPSRRDEAQQALDVCMESAATSGARFVGYEGVRVQVILRELVVLLRDRADLRLPPLEALLSSDGGQASRHGTTLAAFVSAGGAVTETARRLDLHPTTVRYRLRQIERLTGLDLGDPDVRLVCDLMVRGFRRPVPPTHG